ncbi:unnamed protein product [Durusdinium trenchii]|uniref:Palmitoyltransferase n=1 Tax=Durusdinium trenchii TaxID=1381693 RepID=A0ABP0ICL5_9DINO
MRGRAMVPDIYGCQVDEEEALEGLATTWRLEDLPPLPKPLRDKLLQSLGGTAYVAAQIALAVGGTQGFVLTALPNLSQRALLTPKLWWIFFVAIYVEAGIALICLLYLLFGDPGVIRRSAESCFPLPVEVAHKLQQNESLQDLTANIDDGDRTFCVRCLVWRPKHEPSIFAEAPAVQKLKRVVRWLVFVPGFRSGNSHHCRTCGRCVRFFDHHCGVFGRCIAGTICSGNMPFFLMIIFMSFCGSCTCITAFAVSVANWH